MNVMQSKGKKQPRIHFESVFKKKEMADFYRVN
jgi:hypothetical protein